MPKLGALLPAILDKTFKGESQPERPMKRFQVPLFASCVTAVLLPTILGRAFKEEL